MARFRTILAILFLSHLISAEAQVDTNLIVYEPFDYQVFNPIWCLDISGFGWTGPWERITGDDIVIKKNNLDYEGLEMPEGNRCAAEFVRAGIRFDRPIEEISDDGQTIWISVLMNFRPDPHPNNVGNITLLKNGQQAFTFGRKFGIQRFGVVFAPNVTPYNTDIATDGLHWVVVKIQFSGDSNGEQAWMWIDPSADMEPDAASADLVLPQSGLPDFVLNQGFDGVQLKNEGTPPLLLDYDEFRIGRTFAAVQPFSPVTSVQTPTDQATSLVLFPNPVASQLHCSFYLTEASWTLLEIYSSEGKLIDRSTRTMMPSGAQTLSLALENLKLPAGTYYLRVITNQFISTASFLYLPD